MKKIIITTISFVFMAVMSFSQDVIETYDVSKDKQTTVIVKDKSKSDKDILSELDLDDYTVGEEVYITAEMWEKIQKEQESKKNTANKEDLALVSNNTAVAAPAKVEREEEVKVEKKEEKAVEKPAKSTAKEKTSSTTTKKKVTKKKKSKKVKRYRYKKPKRKKRRRVTRRSSRTTCYSF